MTYPLISQFVAASVQTETVRDASGRELTLRKLTALDRLRLFKAVGSTLSQNYPYLGMAMLASSVTMIDGIPVPAPVTEAQVEALVAKLGDIGIAAVAEAVAASDSVEVRSTEEGN